MEFPPSACSLPHQTGVTERSIRDDDWDAVYRVIENVMVGHLQDGISACLGTDPYRHHHFLVAELRFVGGNKSRGLDRIKHPFKIILPHHHRCEEAQQQWWDDRDSEPN